MSKATVTYQNGQWLAGVWSTPLKVIGEDGEAGMDGKFWDYRYKVDVQEPQKPSGLDPSGQGWYNQPSSLNSNEDLYMSFCEKNADQTAILQDWSNPVRISGEKGQNGTNGKNGTDGTYFEYRYAKNGSTTTCPTISITTENPSGWTTTMPSVGVLEYLWMTVAKKSASGILLQNWSTPVRTNGEKGQKGDKGDAGLSIVFRGVYSSSATYYGTAKRVDVVKYNNTYFVARVDAGDGFSGQAPTNTSYWNTFGAQFDSVATNLLLAELANIADWIICYIFGIVIVVALAAIGLFFGFRKSKFVVSTVSFLKKLF